MQFKGFDKQSNKLKKLNKLDKRFTSDGTEFTMTDIPENGVMLFFDEIMFFPKGRLAEKVYYPTAIEGKVLYPNVPYSRWSQICTHYNVKMPATATEGIDGKANNFWEWVHQQRLPVFILDDHWEVLRLLSKDVLAAYCVPFTNRPREDRDFRK
ncbi:hypothetical protein [Microcoleus vaginatus]|uniref:hypothetical protein n=1 Tax=Microcoleus vaginatus TaxID=119532 RepID=UPI0032A2C712